MCRTKQRPLGAMEPNNHSAQDGQVMRRHHVQVSHNLSLCSLHVVSHREQVSTGMLARTKDCEAERNLVVMAPKAILITTPERLQQTPSPKSRQRQEETVLVLGVCSASAPLHAMCSPVACGPEPEAK